MRLRLFALLLCLFAWPQMPDAHEVRPAYLSLNEEQPGEWQVVWKQPVLEGKRLRLKPTFSSADAKSNCPWTIESRENLPGSTVERGKVDCDIETVEISGLDRTLTDVIVEVRRIGSEPSTTLLRPNAATLDLTQPPQGAASAYFKLGIEHIVLGWDHLLFVIGLVMLIGARMRLLGVVTAFTLAHSLTLGMAALGWLFVPSRPVEILIAASIVLLAIEILRNRQGSESLVSQRPYLVSLVVGLVHGLGFAGALADIGLPQNSELMALLLFNLGVEAGQIGVIGTALALLWLVGRLAPQMSEKLTIISVYIVGAIGMYWVIDRLTGYWTA